MSFLSVIAFCAATELGKAMHDKCVLVSDDVRYGYQECIARNDQVLFNKSNIARAFVDIEKRYDHVGKIVYHTYCVKEENARDFYQRFGIPLDDLDQYT